MNEAATGSGSWFFYVQIHCREKITEKIIIAAQAFNSNRNESMKYNTIVIDPPWNVSMCGKFGHRSKRPQKLPYETLDLEDIKNFPIKDYANFGSHVYLWTTNKFLRESFEVFDKWDVRFHLMMVGVKPSGVAPNCGYVFGTEFCLVGFFGKPAQKWKSIGKLNWFKMFNQPGKHSAKPDDFYNLVETMSHGPYIDIFSRKNRKGWDAYGDEVGKYDTIQSETHL